MNKLPMMADHDPVALLPDNEQDEAKIVKSRHLNRAERAGGQQSASRTGRGAPRPHPQRI